MARREEILEILGEMRGRFDSGFTLPDMRTLDALYREVCGKRVRRSKCRDCYRDAYVEIRAQTKSRNDIMATKGNYRLKPGVLLHTAGSSKYYTLGNITDEGAEERLAKFPKDIVKFQTYPADWEERVRARLAGEAYTDADNVDELKKRLAVVQAQLTAAVAETASLKAENEALKAATLTPDDTAVTEAAKAEAQEKVESTARKSPKSK